jgi:hypothetical protein
MKTIGFLLLAIGLVGMPLASAAPELAVQTSVGSAHTKTGDVTSFHTTITNRGTTASSSIVAALNIVKANAVSSGTGIGRGTGINVDPEDWAPERTQSVPPLAPGQSVVLNWTIFSILAGDYMVYVVAIPEPGGPDLSSTPVSGPALHLIVQGVSQYNPGGVLPMTVGVPIVVGLVWLSLRIWRRRGLDADTQAVA